MQPTATQDSLTRVQQAIRQAANQTGTQFDYLLKTATRESSLNPSAKARTSSATGLFQFIEQTWLQMVKEEGPRFGMTNAAAAISKGADGRYFADPKSKSAILALREHPETAAALAAAFTERNREQLAENLGRAPSSGELYAAHVLGVKGATQMVRTAAVRPETPAASVLPDAAAANRSIFYSNGKPRSAAEVLAKLAGGPSEPVQAVAAINALAGITPAASAPVTQTETVAAYGPENDAAPFHSLFHTGRRTPVANYVASTWAALPATATTTTAPTAAAPLQAAQTAEPAAPATSRTPFGFLPRARPEAANAGAAAITASLKSAEPRAADGTGRASAAEESGAATKAEKAERKAERRGAIGEPLNLLSFLKPMLRHPLEAIRKAREP